MRKSARLCRHSPELRTTPTGRCPGCARNTKRRKAAHRLFRLGPERLRVVHDVLKSLGQDESKLPIPDAEHYRAYLPRDLTR